MGPAKELLFLQVGQNYRQVLLVLEILMLKQDVDEMES